MDGLNVSNNDPTHLTLSDDEVITGNESISEPDSGSSESINWKEAYFALNTAFNEVKGRYQKTQQHAADLKKEIKQFTRREAKGTGASEMERNKIFQLEQENTRLRKKMSALQAQLKASKQHHSAERNYSLELEEANKKIDELNQHLLKQKRIEVDQENSEMEEELEKKLKKSFGAYNEKYNECEELKKTIEELKKSNSITNSGVEDKKEQETKSVEVMHTETQTQQFAEPADALDCATGKLQTDNELLELKKRTSEKREQLLDYLKQILGLEFIEEDEKYLVLLNDRDRLQQWLTDTTFGSVRIHVDSSNYSDSSTETVEVNQRDVSVQVAEEFQQQLNNIQAREVLLKQKVQDQAAHIERLHRVMNEMNELRETQQKELEQMRLKCERNVKSEDKGVLTDPDEFHSSKDENHVLVRLGDVLKDAKELQEVLERQRNCLKQLASTTEEYHNLSVHKSESKDQNVNEVLSSIDTDVSSTGARPKKVKKQRSIATKPLPLSVPVQETDKQRRTAKLVTTQTKSQHGNDEVSRKSSQTDPSVSAEGGLVESDIEILADEDTDNLLGAAVVDRRTCPVCSNYFSETVPQEVYERHVQSHFDSDTDE